MSTFRLTDAQKLNLRRMSDITVEALPEEASIRGNALASGDEAEDTRAENEIIRQLDSGNEWAWCTVKVSVKWRTYEATEYLGCCSYRSKAEFVEGDYFVDMVATAFDEVVARIESTVSDIAALK